MTAMGICLVGFFASPPIAVTDSKPTRIRMATVAWMNTQLSLCGDTTAFAVGCVSMLPLESLSGYAIVNGTGLPAASSCG